MVPLEILRRGPGDFIVGEHSERLAVQRIVVAAVAELFADTPADLDLVVQRYREVAKIEKIVKGRSEAKARSRIS